MPRSSWLTMRSLLLALLLAAPALSQVTTATLYGTVTDSSGAAVAGAEVAVTNEATGLTQTASADERGEFTFTFLPVGRYTVSIRAQGFKGQTQAGVELAAGQRLRLPYALGVGEVGETVQVTADAPLVNTVSPELRASLSTTQVRELPTVRRDWTNLLNLSAGAVVSGGTNLTINGLAPQGFGFTIDGTDANANPESSAALGMMDNPNFIKAVSLDAISEVNLVKGIASAEYASAMSGNLNVITRSGGNELHGSVFENYQSGGLNALNSFLRAANGRKPKTIFHQFGGSAGGPIIKNKLFFFGVYEGYRQTGFTAFNSNVATREFRERAIAATPAYKQWFDFQPLPNQPYAANATTGLYIAALTNRARDDHYVGRADYQLSDASRASVRYTHSDPFRVAPRIATINPREFISRARAVTASFTTARSRWSSETRFGYNHTFVDRLDGYIATRQPLILTNLGFGDGGAEGRLLQNFGTTYSVDQIFALNLGRHAIKFGGRYSRFTQTRQTLDTPEYSYSGVNDFLANRPNSAIIRFDLLPYGLTEWMGGLFVQDDFKLRPNLVVNLGLRYDFFSVPRERDDRLFNRGTGYGYGPLNAPDNVYNADTNNFGPRVGFAWTVDANAKTVVAGGFGVSYSRPPLEIVQLTIRNSLSEPFEVRLSRTEAINLNVAYPRSQGSILPLFRGVNAPWTQAVIDENYPTPYAMQWTLSVQRQLTRALALETAYVGNRGVKMLFARQQNLIDRQTGVRPVAGFGEFRYHDTSESSRYHALQTTLRSRFARGLTASANYTYASNISYNAGDIRSFSTPQDNNNLRNDRAATPFHVRHRFVSDFIYELPFAELFSAQSRGEKLLFGGWQFAGIFTAQTGLPINIAQPGSPIGGQRADYVGGSFYANNPNEPLLWLSRAAFAAVPTVQLTGAPVRGGTLGRNVVRLPGFWNLDLALSKNLALTERLRLQLRADMFNALNHTTFDQVQTTLTAANFGRLTRSRDARIIQFNARFSF
jgi:outer membrane receptor protein involved in Fe transport